MIFAGISILLSVSFLLLFCETYCDSQVSQAAKDLSSYQDKLIDVFNRIEHFFQRLDIYTGITSNAAMMGSIVEIMVEVINILAFATREVGSGRLGESISHRFTLLYSHLI